MRLTTFKGLCAVLAVLSFGAPAALARASGARATAPHCVGGERLPGTTDLASVDAVTVCLVNAVRAAHHLHLLHANPALSSVAATQVRQMLALDYFADVGPSGQTPQAAIAASSYPRPAGGFTMGQNLAWGTGQMTSPATIVAAWMASPPHRAIILDPAFRDAGAAVVASVPAVVESAGAGATYAMEFGVRR